MKFAHFLWLGLAAVGLSACGTPKEEAVEESVELRLIAEDPSRLLRFSDIAEVQAFDWTVDAAQDLEAWTFADAADRTSKLQGKDWVVESKAPRVELIRDAGFEARDVDRIDLLVAGAIRGSLRLAWAASGEEFSDERSMSIKSRYGEAQERGRLYSFEVAEHAEWSGSIERLALRIDTGSILRIRSIVGHRYELGDDQLTDMISRPWKVDRGYEVRNVLLAPPGLSTTHDFELPPQARFRFGYSIPTASRVAVTFRVALEASGASQEVFSAEIAPGAPPEEVWRDAEVDLSQWAGENVRLTLETESDEDFDLLRDLPVWSTPEILGETANSAPNLVLISLDTLRADHLSLYGYKRPTSPNLEEWAADGVVFENAVAPASWTLPSHVSMLTGYDALAHGVNYPRAAPESLEFLAEILRREQYQTTALTAGGYLHPSYGLVQGFDRFRYEFDGVSREEEMATAMAWLGDRLTESRDQGRPFFLFYHTYETHDPFLAREPYFEQFYGEPATPGEWVASQGLPIELGARARRGFRLTGKDGPRDLGDEDLDLVTAYYDSEIAFADQQLRKLFDKLDELGLRENTIVALTSDHGEAMGEHDFAGHGNLYDDNLMIPMVIVAPDKPARSRVENQVRLVDLFPTLLELLDVPSPGDLTGVSLAPLLRGESMETPEEAWSYNALSNHGLALRIGNRMKYIFSDPPWLRGEEKEEVYRLTDDQGETRSLMQETANLPAMRRRVRRRLLEGHAGLRIELFASEQSAGSVSGELRGPIFRPTTVKSPDAESAFSWASHGKLSFAAQAGEESLLLLQEILTEKVVVRGVFRIDEQEHPIQVELTLSEEPMEIFFACAADGCDQRSEAGDATAGLRFEWTGKAASADVLPSDADPELRQRLKELGYLD